MLTASDVKAGYGGILAVNDVSIEVAAGSIVALIGANGAGKTTLVNTLAGVMRPTAGSIRFGDAEIAGFPSYAVARRGLLQVPEGRQVLAPLTVRENLELGWQALGRRGRPAARDMDRVVALFPRLEERFAQRAGSLSGGEQQMLAIGRALMGRPVMLMLDEPSLGLSPLIVSQVFDAIRQLNEEGLTLLLVEQNARRALALARYAYVIERGRVVTQGPSAVLQQDSTIQESYLGRAAGLTMAPARA